ncbi:MAG: MMPL family transporter [bacterium]|nr:MMPL family transporter [Acidimicrobiia bacterium]MCY4650458.1 MMPL family transporter [bacterium]
MSKILDRLRILVTGYPWITVGILIIITVALGAGSTYRAEPPETAETLPQGSEVAKALDEIQELFGDAEAHVATLVFRGEALTPEGLSQMDNLISEILDDPSVKDMLAPPDPVFAPSLLVKAVLGVDSLESVTQAEIDSVRSVPGIAEVFDAITGIDTDGTSITIANINLRDTNDDRIYAASRTVHEFAKADEGPLSVSSVSPVVIEDEYKRATEEGMAPLVGAAFLLIAALILLFIRAVSDLLLTLGGLFVSIVWIIGTEGWLGPNALDLIGPPNSLTTMVPIILIGLTVDYAIQIISHYREQRVAGHDVRGAVQVGLRHVTMPLTLAAVTTVVSLLVNLFSPIGIVNDFGVIAGMGVAMSLLVMLTLIPAGRTIIDRRKEAKGKLKPARPISNSLPGVRRLAELLGRSVTRRPTPYIVGVVAVTVALGFAATDLESEFNIRDILPRGGGLLEDMDTLDATIGGSTEMYSVLVKSEATETRTLLNLHDFTTAFQDERLRPGAAAGPIQASYNLIVQDWTTDSGEPGDNYHPELAALLQEASVGIELDSQLMQELLDRIEALDPALGRLLINDPDGVDTMLIQFPAFAGDTALAKNTQRELDELWLGDSDALTATSSSIISFTVTDAITEQQTEAISTTIAVALTVLALFFWVTVRQPALGFIAVFPILLVLISVLGTMALLGIPYSLITSIITALSIGIGVDYTIHMIHRYREEYALARDPEQAAIRTLSVTGSALLGSAMTTALGLGVLIFSPLVASQQFAITAAITIAYSLIVSIVLVPPAMTIWGAYQNVRLRSKMQRWESELDELDEALEAVYERFE